MRLGIRDRIEIFTQRMYYRWWACPRGQHYMKFRGCIYCGH